MQSQTSCDCLDVFSVVIKVIDGLYAVIWAVILRATLRAAFNPACNTARAGFAKIAKIAIGIGIGKICSQFQFVAN